MSALFRATRAADFDKLYQHHAASVYRYALAVLGNRSDAEDVTQQTFLNAYRAIEQGTKPRKTENWLLAIAHNEVRRLFRSRGKTVEVELDERLAQPVPEGNDPSFADVLRALQHLPPAQRSAIVMREFEGRSYAEIAELLDVTQSALETLIFRARRALAEQLEGAITCAEAEQAFSRRLDGRLPRREARRLKAHLKECPLCVRFGAAQKRQRSLLKGLAVMPIPVPLLFRSEPAAAGLGLAGATAGAAPLAAGGAAAAGAGASGLAAGLLAKAAAVTAAAVVTGGVGYGVATNVDGLTRPGPEAVPAAAEQPGTSEGRQLRAAPRRPPKAPPARSATARALGSAKKGRKLRPAHPTRPARKKALTAVAAERRAVVAARPATPASAKPEKLQASARRQIAKRPDVAKSQREKVRLKRAVEKPKAVDTRPRPVPATAPPLPAIAELRTKKERS